MLNRPTDLKFPAVAERAFVRVNRRLHPDDVFYQGDDKHYLSVGASALKAIDSALQLAGIDGVTKILDFGCGAGRVTRWLCAAFPESEISVTDLRESDLEFCAKNFRVAPWQSGTDIDTLQAPDRYDLIWAGSVLTHLSAAKSLNLLNKLISWTRPGGLVVVSLHGRAVIDNRRRKLWDYLHDSGWRDIESDYQRLGYGYADYENQNGYGISLVALDWIVKRIMDMSRVRLVLLSERAWDNHQDMLALQIVPDNNQAAVPF
jgi:SAM-dependent methyltransferase